jgi:energy-coupling factor transporter ATP-binding protein EcfA2
MINFFAGHSGSGKSTIIDALQVLLYANTDGKNFFNKAATDDSDRTLIEYLRGMVNIKEDNDYTYLRNRNFSTTIVMELRRTDTGEKQCIGAAFDVITANNECSKTFFWHKGPLPDSYYRTAERTMSIDEVKEFIRNNYPTDQYYFESTNERFRAKLYDVYLGGLNQDRFPQLFKKAIPFKMDMKLSEFVKEYICIEQDTNIEDMQESVTQYGRMCRQIKDIQEEVKELSAIQQAFDAFFSKETEAGKLKYFVDSLELMEIRQQEETCKLKDESYNKDLVAQNRRKDEIEKQIKELEDKKEELIGKISASGYDSLLHSMETLNQLIQRLSESKGNWIRRQTA